MLLCVDFQGLSSLLKWSLCKHKKFLTIQFIDRLTVRTNSEINSTSTERFTSCLNFVEWDPPVAFYCTRGPQVVELSLKTGWPETILTPTLSFGCICLEILVSSLSLCLSLSA